MACVRFSVAWIWNAFAARTTSNWPGITSRRVRELAFRLGRCNARRRCGAMMPMSFRPERFDPEIGAYCTLFVFTHYCIALKHRRELALTHPILFLILTTFTVITCLRELSFSLHLRYVVSPFEIATTCGSSLPAVFSLIFTLTALYFSSE